MPAEGIEIVQHPRLQENSGSMEFAETKEVSRWSPRELKFVRYTLRLEDLAKSFNWQAYVMSGAVPTWLHAQYLPQGKEKLLLKDILCLKRRSCLPLQHFTQTESHEESPSKLTSTTSLFCGRFQSLLVAFRNSKTRRHSEIKQTRPFTKQDFSGEALSKQNTEASLASLSCNSSRAMTERSAIFAFGV